MFPHDQILVIYVWLEYYRYCVLFIIFFWVEYDVYFSLWWQCLHLSFDLYSVLNKKLSWPKFFWKKVSIYLQCSHIGSYFLKTTIIQWVISHSCYYLMLNFPHIWSVKAPSSLLLSFDITPSCSEQLLTFWDCMILQAPLVHNYLCYSNIPLTKGLWHS